jgi:prepilin-type N-terminal cleavage/methylation domain-containing protein
MPTERPGTAEDSGFTLLEVLVAIVVIGTVMTAVAPFLVQSLALADQQRDKQVAIQVANDALERVRALAPASLPAGRSKDAIAKQWDKRPRGLDGNQRSVDSYLTAAQLSSATSLADTATDGLKAPLPTSPYVVTVNGKAYAQNWYIGVCYQAKAQTGPIGDCGAAVAPVPFYRVVVAVTWTHRSCPASACVYLATTLVSKGDDPVFDLKRPAPTVVDPPAQSGYVATAASLQVTSTGGRLPLTWTATGLPPGLTMSSSALISGTPTTAGTYTVVVRVTDRDARTDDTTFTWTVVQPPALTNPGTQTSRTGTAVSLTVAGTGGVTPFVWSATNLPAGLTINAATGLISGTPTTAQTLTTTVTLTDAGKPTARTATVSFSWRVLTPVKLDPIGTVTVSQGTTGSNFTPTARDGLPPYTWATTNMPAGVSMNPGTGAVTGTFTNGTRWITGITVTDSAGGVASITVVVNVTATVKVTAPNPSSPDQSTALNVTPTLTTATATGGTAPYTWTAAGLPTGLSLSTAGVISGKPTVKGTSVVTFTAKDAANRYAYLMFTWTVT